MRLLLPAGRHAGAKAEQMPIHAPPLAPPSTACPSLVSVAAAQQFIDPTVTSSPPSQQTTAGQSLRDVPSPATISPFISKCHSCSPCHHCLHHSSSVDPVVATQDMFLPTGRFEHLTFPRSRYTLEPTLIRRSTHRPHQVLLNQRTGWSM